MTTLIERARKWGEELNQQWLEKGIEQGRREGVERGRLEGIELGIPHGVERGRLEGERSLVYRLVTRRFGAAAAVHFVPVLNRLSGPERIAAIVRLPPHNKFSVIAKLEEVRSPEELEELAATLADWVERAGAPELLDCFRAWVTLVLAPQVHSAGGTLKLGITSEVGRTMTTIIERARQRGQELNQQWREKGIEQGRREGVTQGWLEGIGLGMGQGVEQGWLEVERELVDRLVTQKFGPGAAEQLVPVLDRLSDPERIAAIADAVLECETTEECLTSARETART